MKIRTLIVDDERAARQELRCSLQSFPLLDVVGEAASADEAAQLINTLQPQLLFLDVQMPGRSGFDLLESLTVSPVVIFVTAYDTYAFKAFEVSALDYLLKPVRDERLAKAVLAAQQKLSGYFSPHCFLREGDRFHFVDWTKVSSITSADPYVRIQLPGKKLLMKSSLSKLENTLPAGLFFRANRWQLVNLAQISSMRMQYQALHAILADGAEVVFSERQSVLFKKLPSRL